MDHGAALCGYAEACVRGDPDALREARDALEREMGAEALVDAAAVVANFQRMVRIADATGIPLDRPVAVFSVGLREELGLDAYGAAAHTPRVGPLMRALGRLGQPLLRPIMRRYASRTGRGDGPS